VAAALQLGSVVWAEIADPNGHSKLRPAVVVTPTNRIERAAMLDLVAVTSRLADPLPSDHVLLPWHAQGHPRTGLNRRCAAVCSWIVRIPSANVREIGGVVPGAIMTEILRRIATGMPP
jgi:mRNA-degrading endonuclease toxin of MazEF toxin-antitoxin module